MMKTLRTITTRVSAAGTAFTVVVATFLLLAGYTSAHGQELPVVELEAPILPEGTLESPVGSPIASEAMNAGVSCHSCGGWGCENCGPGFACPPGLGLWIRAEYMLWWEKAGAVIPLLTTSTGIPADPATLLTLDAAETRVLFGGDEVENNPLDGWRIEGGTWLDATATHGLVGRYFAARGRHITFAAGPNSFNFLGVPFFDEVDNAEDAFDATVVNELRGAAEVNLSGDAEGFEILFRRNAHNGNNYRLDWLYGYRHFNLEESLGLQVVNLVTGDTGLNPVGTEIAFRDQFDMDNQFNGFDIGFTGHSHEGMWSLDFLAKIALGNMNQDITISGTRVTSVPGLERFRNIGGLFSQETNIGNHDQDKFAFIPEVNVNISYALTSNLDFTFGYTWMYVGDVVRAGSSIDRVVNTGLLGDLDVDSDRPTVVFDEVSYWLQGLNFGLTGRF